MQKLLFKPTAVRATQQDDANLPHYTHQNLYVFKKVQ